MKKKINFEKLLKYWAPVVLWMGVIFIFSSYPTVKTSEVLWKEFFIKKSAHIIEFGILALLIFRALRNTYNLSQKNTNLISILLASLYGVTDEYHQSYTSGREPTVRDALFDFVGSFLAVIIVSKYFLGSRIKIVREFIRRFEL
jgi:VanZ family protein